ncbi:MAG: histidine phosphatase family protein [Crocinitomicaceae bacterium]|nr:histidine phosphatase family protein [Crocinitomicaceae bacterium]
MKRILISLTVLSVLIWMTSSFVTATLKKDAPIVTSLIIVRHAEKNNETDTTTLTPAGYDRSQRLATWLTNTNLSAIYTTPFVRMQQTAEPTAKQKKLPIQDYTPHEIPEIDRIISANSGKTVLVVGHGNSIPNILNHYTGSSLQNLSGYNDIFVLNIINAKLNTNRYLHFYY